MLKRNLEPLGLLGSLAHLTWRTIRSPRRAVRALMRTARLKLDTAPPLPSALEWSPKRALEAGPEAIRFTRAGLPTVSVVIPVHNHIGTSLACLRSIADCHVDASFEVILVDDASSDPRRALLQHVRGLRVLRSDDQRGFVDSCNWGAKEAQGELLLFLNNDTLVTEGWLDSLVGTFEDFPEAGIVGAKLVFYNGRLQEAGGIVWRDGSAWNYGRGMHPDKPEHNYARDVDYCSGACLMVSASLFDDLGGFDSAYRPAYYEDTDVAFRARERGARVIFQPACTVFHDEGTTAGRRVDRGVKRYQIDNRKQFYRRWRATLRTHARNGQRPEREKERRVRHRALMIGRESFDPDDGGDSTHLFESIRTLSSQSYKVTLLPEQLGTDPARSMRLRSLGVEVLYAPFVTSIRAHLAARGDEYDLVLFETPELSSRYDTEVRRYCRRAEIEVNRQITPTG